MITYAQVVEVFKKNPHRSVYSLSHAGVQAHMVGHDVRFTIYGINAVLLSPDGVYTIDYVYSRPSVAHCDKISAIVGVGMCLNAKGFRGYEVTIRVGKYTYLPGIKFQNRLCVNPEFAIDRKRRINKDAVTRATRKMKNIKAVAIALARLEEFPKKVYPGRDGLSVMLKEVMSNLASPTVEHAEMLFQLGYHRVWWRRPESEHSVADGLKALREAIYEADPDAYYWEEIKHDDMFKEAA